AFSDGNGGTYISEIKPVSWLNAADGDFAIGANWDNGGSVPGPADAVFITASGSDYTVTSSSGQTVNSISIGADATLAIDGGTFTISNGTEFGSIAGQLAVNDGSTLVIGLQIHNSGTLTLNSTGDDTTLNIVGYTTLSGGGNLTLGDNSHNIITGAAGATLTNVDNTISGSGGIGGGQLTLINGQNGTIKATGNHLGINTRPSKALLNDGNLTA